MLEVGQPAELVAGLAAYIALIPSVQQRLISIAPRETAEQREDLEFKLGVMRRLILSVGFVAFDSYWRFTFVNRPAPS